MISREDKIKFNQCFSNDESESKGMPLDTFYKMMVEYGTFKEEPSLLSELRFSARTRPLTDEEQEKWDDYHEKIEKRCIE